MSKKIEKYLNQYRDELLENVLPFWMKNSKDTEGGGYFTCLTREGEVFDTDKFVWLQGRETWFFAMLYNHLETNKNGWILQNMARIFETLCTCRRWHLVFFIDPRRETLDSTL